MTDKDLDRIANNLDFIRALGNLAPERRHSLYLAAGILRAISNGDVSRALAAAIVREGYTLSGAGRVESGR